LLGVFCALERLLPLAAKSGTTASEWVRASAGAGFALLAFGVAGIGVAVLLNATAAAITAYLNRLAELTARTVDLGSQAVASLERIAGSLNEPERPRATSKESTARRARSLVEIQDALRGAHWAEAETLLNAFAAEYPDDPETAALRDALEDARHDARQEHLAQLDAARQVNDPQRVLEIYHIVAPIMERESRAGLDRSLAQWFLSLIQRRLRTGKIQQDVVFLATRVAEVFAATVEGASLRASLPTLRRSVGLCPRCGQPYMGPSDACPKCLTENSATA
jgi:hypothetical protein